MTYQPGDFRRAVIPNGKRRSREHDYHRRWIYMVTMNAAVGMPLFSVLKGTPGDHYDPPRVEPLELGNHIACALYDLKNHFPVSILRKVIMPEHIHFVIFVKEDMPHHLGDVISFFKAQVTRAAAGVSGVRTEGFEQELSAVFEKNYHDRILLRKGQKQRMLDYVSDNPRRRLLRMQNPGFHHRFRLMLKEESCSLGEEYKLAAGSEFEAYGNIDMLMEPAIEAVRISRKYSDEELLNYKRKWLETIITGGVIVSPFISEKEKKVRNWACENGGRLIIVRWEEFGERYKPAGRLFDLCSEGRLLEISFKGPKGAEGKLGRRECMLMNELAAAIAEGKVMDPRGRC